MFVHLLDFIRAVRLLLQNCREITSLSICVGLIDLYLDLVFGEMQETCIFHFAFF